MPHFRYFLSLFIFIIISTRDRRELFTEYIGICTHLPDVQSCSFFFLSLFFCSLQIDSLWFTLHCLR